MGFSDYDRILMTNLYVLTALHVCRVVLATSEMSVCLFVHLSICQTHELWQNKRSLHPNFCTTPKSTHPSFL